MKTISALKLIKAIRKDKSWVAHEVVHSATESIRVSIEEWYAEKSRADQFEALLREARSELHCILYENMWTKRMELCRRIDAALKGEQQ